MRPIISFIFAMSAIFSLTGCIANSSSIANAAKTIANSNTLKPSGQTIKRSYKVGEFSKLDISHCFKVTYRVSASSTPTVEISMPSNYEKHISVRNNSGELDIEAKDLGNKSLSTKEVTIAIQAPACSEIELSGVVELTIEGNYSAGKKLGLDVSGCSSLIFKGSVNVAGAMDAESSGASSISIPSLDCAWISTDVSGTSAMTINKARITNDARMDASGASKITMTDITSVRRIEAETSGTSKISIGNVKAQSIEGDASGASRIEMAGQCGDVKKSESGTSKVNFTAR